MQSGKMTLKELLEQSLNESASVEIPIPNGINILSNEKKCASFINSYLQESLIDLAKIDNVVIKRARHSTISFLLGRVLIKAFNLRKMISNAFQSLLYPNFDVDALCSRTSISHDYGYYLQERKRDNSVEGIISSGLFCRNESITQNFDAPPFGILSYGDYINYYRYFLENLGSDAERYEHGILGASELYSRAKKHLGTSTFSPAFVKTMCIAIASHNVFKADEGSDNLYREYKLSSLLSTSSYCVSSQTPLTLFLSLVDTLEPVKRFSKKQSETNEYFETMTVLKCINLSFSKDNTTLIWDVSELSKRVKDKKSKEVQKNFDTYIHSIMSLNKWTSFKVVKTDFVFEISLNDYMEV